MYRVGCKEGLCRVFVSESKEYILGIGSAFCHDWQFLSRADVVPLNCINFYIFQSFHWTELVTIGTEVNTVHAGPKVAKVARYIEHDKCEV